MNILYVYPLYIEGGSNVHAAEFVSACQRLGNKTSVVSIPVEEGKTATNIAYKLLRFCKNNILCLTKFLAAYFSKNPDYIVIRFQPNHTLFLCIVAARALSKLVLEVNATRSIEPAGRSDPLERMLDRWSFGLANRLFAVSNVVRTRLLDSYDSLSPAKLSVIHNGCNLPSAIESKDIISLRVRLGLNDYETVVGYVGSFRPWHDVDSILTVAKNSPPTIGYLIIGDGPGREACEAKAIELDLRNVHFLGNIDHDQIYHYIDLFDLALLTVPRAWCSQPGGFHGSPLKLFDYMAMGKPVIATASGDISNIVEDGIHGYHVAPEDTGKILDKILYLAKHKELARQLGHNGREKVAEKYTWDANAEQVATLCLSLN